MREKQGIRKTIFMRIIIRLTFPLLLLTLFFTAIQLTNQVNTLNQLYKTENRLALELIQRTVAVALKNPDLINDPEALKSKIDKALPLERKPSVQIFDVYNRKLLLKDKTHPWTSIDNQAVEKSLYEKQRGKPYYILIDKVSKRLIAFIPFQGANHDQVWITRVLFPLAQLNDAFSSSKVTLVIMVALIGITGLVIGRALTKLVARPVRLLSEASKEIMQGNLGIKVSIKSGDEFESLANTFNHMSSFLKVMKASAEDANPLTQLPGNHGIACELQKRISEKQKFVIFHTDLNRFKTYNDHYGLAKGDEVITRTADLIKKTLKEKGAPDDYVGHQGGDDFVVIVKPNHAEEVGKTIVERFDTDVVKIVYSKEDYERGYTMAYDRRAMAETGSKEAIMAKFPLLSISLAGASNAKRDFGDYNECLKMAAVVIKKEVKKKVESSYLIRE